MGRNKLTLNEFYLKLMERYPGIDREFVKLMNNPRYSLSDIARKYNFTREYARQIFEKIYGISYSAMIKRLKGAMIKGDQE
jgi:hypothetical protein